LIQSDLATVENNMRLKKNIATKMRIVIIVLIQSFT
jgi:hypothetical protein